MDTGLLVVIEVMLRVALGLRLLSSGISNVRRWPHAVGTAKVVFAKGTKFFALMAVAFMVLGGFGVAAGFGLKTTMENDTWTPSVPGG